jgi:predicted dehydrogenase
VCVGVIGFGYWGPNLVRNFLELDECEVVGVCDLDRKRLDHLAKHYPGIDSVPNWRELVSDPRVDAVVIATPVSTHYQIAREALEAGKHVLVEKPLAFGSEGAQDLVARAEGKSRVLMVGHTFVYHGAVRKIHDLIRDGELGKVLYFDSTRANLGRLQDDINVVWDLAPHDLSIMDLVVGCTPVSISATGAHHTGRGLEDVAFITLHFADNLIAHINVNWLSPVKIRRVLVGGSRKMIVYDDTEPSEKVKVYDRGIDGNDSPGKRHNDLILHRAGDVFVPRLDLTEALRAEALDFIDSIHGNRRPAADGRSGLRIVRLLELACRSLELDGAPVQVPTLDL